MRKNLSKFRFALLGILMCLISVCAIGQTERTYSYTFTKCVWSSLGTQSIGGWSWTSNGTSTGSYFGYDNTKGQQFGSGSLPFTALTLSTNSIKGTVTSVKVNTSGANGTNATFEVKVGGTKLMSGESSTISLTKTATEYEFTGTAEAGAIELVWEQTSSKALYIKSIEVTYTPDPSFVDAPTFTPSAGNYYEPASVVLETIAEGATIYYTIDGTEPSTSSLLYQEPIAVEQTTTIKAIAVRDTNSSEISAAVYSFPINVNTIAAFKAQGINNSIYKLTTTAKVIYNNPIKKYLFIQDETGALVMYNYTGATYNAGDEITGPIYGTYSLYDGMNEMVFRAGTPALPEATAGTPVDAIVATIAQLKNDYAYYEGRLVTVKNVTFIGNKKFVQGEDTMAFYTQLVELPEFEVGIPGNITGLVVFSSQYTGVQLFPRSINDIELPIELPVVVDFDENPAEGWVINNVTGNNKWYIGQAQGFDNNKLYISSTNGLTNKYGEGVSYATFARFIKIPAVGAKLTFDARINGENNYDYLSVMFKGQTLETYALNNEWNNYTIDIAPEMAGAGILQFVWQNNGSVQNQFPAAVDNISIIPVACAQVSNLNAAVDSTTATITWNAPESQNDWTLEYRLTNHTEWYSVSATTPSVVLNNLQGNSTYEFRVQANCGEESSVWTYGTFATDCQEYGPGVVPADITIGTGTLTSYRTPFDNFYKNTWNECIYPASSLQGAGAIHSISWNCSNADSRTCTTLKIYMGTRATSTFSSESDWTPERDLQLVYDGTNVVVGASTGWQEFVLNTPFNYNGTDNLVVVVSKKISAFSNTLMYYYTSTPNTCMYRENDNDASYALHPGSSTGTTSNLLANIKFNMDVTTTVCVDPISCPDLAGLEVDDITYNSATIDWTLAEGSSQNNFLVEYKLENSSEWTVVPVQDATTLTLSNLNQLSNYNVRVKAVCGENDYSNYVTADFATPGICASVTDITSTNNANVTTLTWLAGGEEAAWTIEFRPIGTENWVSLHVGIIPMTTLGGLVGSTHYEVRIKALCDAQDEANQSAWTYYYFTSGCAAVDVPYTQVFGSYTEPACWSNQDFEFDYSSYAATNDIDAWLMSPAINVPAEGASYVSFQVVPTGNYKLMASYRGTAMARFAEIYAGTGADGEVIVEIPEIYKGRMVNFMFLNGVDNWFKVYNMKVNSCPFVPTQLTASNLTTTSADLTWQGDERVSSWNVEYKTNDGEWTSVEVSTNPYTLTGLEASTSYQVRVKAACNDIYSNTVSFKTLCAAISLPYTEDFDGVTTTTSIATTVMPDCWSKLFTGTATYYGVNNHNYSSSAHSGTNSLRFSLYNDSYYPAQYGDAYAILPEVNAPINTTMISFYARKYNASYSANIEIGVVTDINDVVGTFTRITTVSPTSTTYELFNVLLSDYAGTEGHLALRVVKPSIRSTAGAYVDDITVDTIPTCGTPSISVDGAAVATIVPFIASTPESYDLQIGNEVVTGVQSPANLTVLFPSLQTNTAYEVAVRANCGDEDYSQWSNPVPFITPCLSREIPFFEGFEDEDFAPECWMNYHVSGSGTDLWQRSINYKHTGSGSAMIPDMRATTQTNFVTPPFTIPEANAYRVSVWVYRNEMGTPYQNEGIKVWASTEQEINSNSVELFHAHRCIGFAPVQSATGWYKYEAAIPISGNHVYVIFQGICEYGGATYMDDITIERIPTCETPSISITNAVATITPGQIGTPESYDLQIGNEVVTGVQSPANLSVLFPSLQPNTEYEVAVRANCGDEDYSQWSDAVTFRTPCMAISLPYTEDFESYTPASDVYSTSGIVMPDCWTDNWTVTPTSPNYCPKVTNNSSCKPSTGNYLYFMAGGSYFPYYQNPTIVVLPEFVESLNTAMISFRVRCSDATNGELLLGYVDTDNQFTSLETITCATAANAELQTYDLSAYTFPQHAKLAIKANYTNDEPYYKFEVGIDDIAVELLPTCGTPSISVSGATATITPSALAGTPEAYVLNIGNEQQTVPATTPTTVVDLSTIFTLELSTSYEIRVKSNCGETDGYSGWTAPVSFTTPSCLGGVNVAIETGTTTSDNIPFTPNYGYSYSQQIFDAAEINAPAGGMISEISIYCSTVPSNLSTFGNITVWMTNTTQSTYASKSDCIPSSQLTQVYYHPGQFNLVLGWNKIVLDEPFEYDGTSNLAIAMYEGLAGYSYGVFYTTSTSDTKTVSIYHDTKNKVDPVNPALSTGYSYTSNSRSNIKFEVCPVPVVTCGRPRISVDGTIATITPDSTGTPESYDLHIDGFQDQTVTEDTVDLAVVFTGLVSGTTYRVRVRANCGGDDYSDWSSLAFFTTPCAVVDLPIYEDFESTVFPSNCWSNYKVSESGSYTWASTTTSHSGSKAAYIRDQYSAINHLVTTQFNLTNVGAKLTFWVKRESSYAYKTQEGVQVLIADSADGTNASEVIYIHRNYTLQPVESAAGWYEYTATIQKPAGQYYLIFRGYNEDGGSTYMDDISIEALPTCFAPEDLSVTHTDNSAVITWADSHSHGNYVVEYKEATAETWNTATATEMTYTITGLTPSTDYDVRVKADCGEGDESEYATIDFSTYCLAYFFVDDVLVCPNPTDMAITGIRTPLTACEVTDPVTILVKNTGTVYPIAGFTAHYILNEGDTVTEPVTLETELEPGQEMAYSFNALPTYEPGYNMVYAWIELEGFELEYNYIYDYPYVVTPNTVPYVMDTVPEENLMGWNAFDENNDDITMNLRNRVISYTYNDMMAANDWMISPCFNLTAGAYNIIFDYQANSSLSEQFALYFGQGPTPEDMTQLLSQFVTVDEETHSVSVPVTVAEDGTYNFGFYTNSLAGNMGFQIRNIEVLPVLNVTVTTDGNGTANPSGVVAVNYGENLTLAITPNEMYHVSGVFVDGVQVVNEDPYNANFMLYTLENVTEAHTVSFEFKLEFHIIKSVENENAAYTDVPGYFIPAATDTLMDPTPFTVNFRPAHYYHFTTLELGIMSLDEPIDVTDAVVANEDGSYSYTIDTLVVARYYLNALFDRDKVNINYNVLTGKGYANDSEVLAAPESYTTVVDHSVNGDIDTTVTIAPYTTGDAHSDYHIIDVTVDGQSQGIIDNYTFTDVTADHTIDIKYGFHVNATVRNYEPFNLGSTEIRGTIEPALQLLAEGDATTVSGTVQEHFHLYNLFVDGVDMMNDVTVIANPEGGYSYTYTIDSTIANYNIEAVVKLDTVGIHYHVVAGQGYADNSPLLNEGDNYTTHISFADSILTNVMPAPGYSISSYELEGFDMGAINNYQFNAVMREYFINLTFVPNDIEIVTNAYGHGSVSEGMNFTYNPETPVNYNFVATPEEGYHITSVMINGESQVVPVSGSFQYSIDNVSENYTFDVYFEANTYTVDASVEGAGMINPVGVQTVAYGSDMNFVATANVGSYISSVVVDGVETTYTQVDNVVTLNIPFNDIQENHNVAVTFAVKSFGITADVDENGHGSIDLSQHVVALVNYGMSHVFNFIPEEGYHVSQILVDGEAVEVADSYQFVDVQANHTLVVSFAINEYTLTATSNVEACTITPAQTTANYGTTVNYTINVATGYHLVNVMDNGAEVTVVNNAFAIANINDNHVINANFEANTYVVTVNQPAHAVITPGTQTVAYGATPEYVIVPQAGYEVVSVTAGNALVPVTTVNGVGHFTLSPVHANLEINAVVAQATYTITVLPSQGQGTVSPATNQTVTYGSSKTFTFAPATHYVISDIIVDGVSKGALTSYTFVNIVANHTIQAVFEGNCMVPTGLSVNNVTSTSAQLSWSNTGAASYTVRYQAVGETTYHETTANTNSCTINGLTADAIYYWSVKSNCGAGNESEFSNMQQFITEPSNVCGAPTNLTVDEIYNENVRVSWTSNATTFNVRCKRTADDPSTYVYTYGVSGTEFTFNNLFQATTYNWGVQTVCNYATGNLSAWAESTFTTGSTGIATDELSSIKVYSHLNNVYVVNDNGIVIKDVKIYDIYGKLVYTGNATSNPEVIALNVANGNYVVKLDTENGVAVYKLAIIR